MSKFSNNLITAISSLEDGTEKRDTTLRGKHWAQNVLDWDNQLEMLIQDQITHLYLTEHNLPEPLPMDIREKLLKQAQWSFGAQKELKELSDKIAQMLAFVEELDEEDERLALGISDEMLQRAQDALKAYKEGATARDATERTKSANASKRGDLRDLSGTIRMVHHRPDGSKEDFFRNNNANGASWAIKNRLDKWAIANNVAIESEHPEWDRIGTELSNLGDALKEANETRIPVEASFEDSYGNRVEMRFPA